MDQQQKTALIIVAAIVGMYAYIQLLCYVISLWSGWRALLVRFRYDQQFVGTIHGWQSARMRYGANYNNALNMGADQAGLYMSAVWIVPQHPPLYIPWPEIKLIGRKKIWMWDWTEYELGTTEKIQFTMKTTLAEELLRDAGVNKQPASSR